MSQKATPHFEYEGANGPIWWGALREDWAKCSTGTRQSPINITGAVKMPTLKDPTLDYAPTTLRLTNTGHSIQVNYDAGSSLNLNGKTYELAQFHFHVASEHTIDGKSYAMELHLVHRYADDDLAVVGVLLEEGAANPTLAQFWDKLPSEGTVNTGNTLNIADILPNQRGYYTYEGSLTTPGCAEIVTWFVLKTPVSVSKEQVAAFQSVTGTSTARPVQALNGRVIGEFS